MGNVPWVRCFTLAVAVLYGCFHAIGFEWGCHIRGPFCWLGRTKKSPQPMRTEALASMGLAGEVAFEWFLPKIRQRNRTVMTAVLFIEASNILAQEVEYYD